MTHIRRGKIVLQIYYIVIRSPMFPQGLILELMPKAASEDSFC